MKNLIVILFILQSNLICNEINYKIPCLGNYDKIIQINDSIFAYHTNGNYLLSNSNLSFIDVIRRNSINSNVKGDTVVSIINNSDFLHIKMNNFISEKELFSIDLNIHSDSVRKITISKNNKIIILSKLKKILIYKIDDLITNNSNPFLELESNNAQNISTNYNGNLIFYIDENKNYCLLNLATKEKKNLTFPNYKFNENDSYLLSNTGKYIMIFNVNQDRNFLYSFDLNDFVNITLPQNNQLDKNIKFTDEDEYLFYFKKEFSMINMGDFSVKKFKVKDKYLFGGQLILDALLISKSNKMIVLKNDIIESYNINDIEELINELIFSKTERILKPNDSEFLYAFSLSNTGLMKFNANSGKLISIDTLTYFRKTMVTNNKFLYFNYKYLYINDYRNNVIIDSLLLDSVDYSKLYDVDIKNDLCLVNYWIKNNFYYSIYNIKNHELLLDKVEGYTKFLGDNSLITRIIETDNFKYKITSIINFSLISEISATKNKYVTQGAKFLFEIQNKNTINKYDLLNGNKLFTYSLEDTTSDESVFLTIENSNYFIEINRKNGRINYRNFENCNIDFSYESNYVINTFKPNLIYDYSNKSLIIQFPNFGIIVSYKVPQFLDINGNSKYENSILFPNPAKEFLNINFNDIIRNNITSIEIYNLSGEMVYSKSSLSIITSQDGNYKIDISKLTPGVYFIKIGDRFEKFIKI